MGNYVFTTEALVEVLRADAEDETSVHDMGGSIMPMMVERKRPRSTTSATTTCPARRTATAATGATSGRWMPTTTPTWTSCVHPIFNLYNAAWPIYTRRASCRRPSSSTAAWRRSRSSAPARSSPARPCAAACSRRMSGERGRVRRGLGAHGQRADRRGRGRPPGDPRQERGRAEVRTSASTWRPTGSATTSSDGGVVVLGKGRAGHG